MKRIELAQLHRAPSNFADQVVTVAGWVRTIRDSKALGFLELNDGSCFKGVQVVFEEKALSNYQEIARQNVGAALVVKGKMVLTPQAKQPFELYAQEIQVEGGSSAQYPLQKKRHGVEYLRTISHLRPRTNLFLAVNRVRSAAAFAIHQFFHDRGFAYVHTPIITGSDCEGAGEMFTVTTLDLADIPKTEQGAVDFREDFFEKNTSLTVSGQLEAECMAMALGKVYTFGPTFRAEKSYTQRHAAEFWMIEPEFAFADLQDDMDLARDMIKFVIRRVMDECADDLALFQRFVDAELLNRLRHVVDSDFGCISYTEAVEILEKQNEQFTFPVSWGMDLQTEHEKYLTDVVLPKPVFVTDYPKEIKSFYMRLNDDGKTVAAMDLLVPWGLGRSLEEASGKSDWSVWNSGCRNWCFRKSSTSGIWICADTAV